LYDHHESSASPDEGSESHVVQALSCGARGYIRKPFTAEQVRVQVHPHSCGETMTSANQLRDAGGSHESWAPVLELAAREVFELMLGCRLTVPATPAETTFGITSMVGLAVNCAAC
jgi:hypothetical protein